VRHGHFTVNGRKVDIPSYQVKAGDEIAVRERSRKMPVVVNSLEQRKGGWVPEWLQVSAEQMSGRVLNIPTRGSIQVPINEQLIVELYSK
jgi:small subunit ribosomal protein S4